MRRSSWILLLVAGLVGAGNPGETAADTAEQSPAAAEQQRVQQYHAALRRQPEPGYLFDRFYNTWLDHGTLDELEQFLQGQIEESDEAADRLLLAFFYLSQGEPVQTVRTLERALSGSPGHASALYHLARARMQTLDFDGAIEAIESAREAEPDAELAMEIGKLRGRLYARINEPERAREAWGELLEAHPGDEHLYEDLVDLQLEEGLHDEALATAEQLVAQTADPHQRVVRRLRIGDIHDRAGRREQALEVYAGTLADVGAGSWLEREIYAQIEQLFRREDDVTGLRDFYANLLDEHAQRVMLRLRYAEVLGDLGESGPAMAQWRQVLELTPGERGYREGYVDALAEAGEHAEAIERQRHLIEQHPQDGELKVRLAELQHEAGEAEASADTLSEYLASSDGSLFAHLRTARLLERFDQVDRAVAVYEQMREAHAGDRAATRAHAEFLHRIDRREEAIELWRALAAEAELGGLLNVASALGGRSEHEAAFEVLRDRLEAFEDEPRFLAALTEQALRLDRDEEALPWARRRLGLVEQPRQFASALDEVAQMAERSGRIDELVAELEAVDAPSVAQVCLLAELLERQGLPAEADRLLAEAEAQLAADDDAADLRRVLHQRVRLDRHRRSWRAAAEAMQRVVELPGGRNAANLRELVELHERAYQVDEALRWARAWRDLVPTSARPWVREAELHATAGDAEAAVQTLRRAVQRFDSDHDLRAQLAQLHREQGRLGDAQRLYEQLYDESDDLTRRMRWIGEVAQIAEQRGRTRQLIERFETRQRRNRNDTAPLMALAEIYRVNDRYEQRRQALMQATRIEPDNVALLLSIAQMEEREGDFDRALQTLQRAAEIDPGDRARQRMARLHLTLGEEEQAYQLLYELAGGAAMDAEGVERMADAMAQNFDWERAAEFLQEHRDRFDDDYRLAYLHAVALEEAGLETAAAQQFLNVLAADRELPRAAAASAQQQQQVGMGSYWNELARGLPPEGQRMLQLSIEAQQAYYRQQGMGGMGMGGRTGAGPAVFIPGNVEQARIHALVHLHGLSQVVSDAERSQIVQSLRAAGMPAADILLDLPWEPGPSVVGAPELLEEHADDPALASLWILETVLDFGRPTMPGSDAERARRYHDTFRDDWPQLAALAALIVAADNPEQHDWFGEEAVPLLEQVERPGLALVFGVAANITEFDTGLPGATNLPEVTQAKLVDQLLAWYPQLRDRNSMWDETIFLMVSGAAMTRDDLGAYVRLLDGEISASRGQASGASGGGMLGGMMGRDPLLAPPQFPPLTLLDLPDRVLMQPAIGADPGMSMMMGAEAGLPDPEALIEALEHAGEPVLRVLLASAAEDEERVAREIEQMLESETPSVDGHALAAAWAAEREDDPARAIELLDTARYLPMTADRRRRLDGAIVAWSLELTDGDDAAAQQAGRQAALRLRQAQLDSEQREQLLLALEDLGLSEEADALERLAEQVGGALGGFGAGGGAAMPVQPTSQIDRVAELLESGDTERAINIAGRQLRQRAQLQQSPQGRALGMGRDHEVEQLRELLDQHGLIDEVIASRRPDEGANVRQWAHFALVCELLEAKEAALAAYRRILEDRPNHAEARYGVAMLLVDEDPAEAAEHLHPIDDRAWADIGARLVTDLSDRPRSDAEGALARYEMVEHWLANRSPDSEPALAWVDDLLESLGGRFGASSRHRLPGLYAPDDPPDDRQAQAERRERLYRAISEHLIDDPAAAHFGFHHRVALAERDGEDLERFVEPAIAALAHDPSRAQMQQAQSQVFYYTGFGEDGHTPYFRDPARFLVYHAWRSDRPQMLEQTIVPGLEEVGRPREVRVIRDYAGLYFSDAADFVEHAEAYIAAAPSQAAMPFAPDYAGPRSVAEAWIARELDVEITSLLIEPLLTQAQQGGFGMSAPRYLKRYLGALATRRGSAPVRALMDDVAEELVGPREERAEVVREHHSLSNIQSGTINARIHTFSSLMGELVDHPHPAVALAALEQLSGTGLGSERHRFSWTGQLLGGAEDLVERLTERDADDVPDAERLAAAGIDPDDDRVAPYARAILALAGSALMEEPEAFTVYVPDAAQPEQSLLVLLVAHLAGEDEAASALRHWLEGLDEPTFGAGLLRALLSEDQPHNAALAYLAEREGAMDRLSHFNRTALAHIVATWEEPADLSEPAAALYARLTAITETERAERVQTVLEANRVQDLNLEGYGGSRQIAEYVVPLVFETVEHEPRTALALIEQGIELTQQMERSGRHVVHYGDGRTSAGQLLRKLARHPSNDRAAAMMAAPSAVNSPAQLERHLMPGLRVDLLAVAVVRDRVESPVELDRWLMRDLRGAVQAALEEAADGDGPDGLDAALARLADAVHVRGDLGAMAPVLLHYMEEWSPGSLLEVAAWAEADAEGAGAEADIPDAVRATLRREAAMAAGLLLGETDESFEDEATVTAARERAEADYAQRLEDATLSPTYRVHVAAMLVQYVDAPRLGLAAGRAALDALDAEAPILNDDLADIAAGLIAVEGRDEARAEIGAKIVDNYVRRERRARQGSSTAMRYSFGGGIERRRAMAPSLWMLKLAIAIDHDEAVDGLLGLRRHQLAEDPATWLLLAQSGRAEQAARVGRSHLSDAQPTLVEGLTYDAAAHEGVQEMLEHIESTRNRYVAEVILAGFPDAEEEVEARAYPGRAQRLLALAQRLDEVSGDASARERALRVFSREDAALREVAPVIAEEVEGWDLVEAMTDDSDPWDASEESERRRRMALMHVRAQVLEGDLEPVTRLTRDLLEREGDEVEQQRRLAIPSLAGLIWHRLADGHLAELTLADMAELTDDLALFVRATESVHYSAEEDLSFFYVFALAAGDDREGLAWVEDEGLHSHAHERLDPERLLELAGQLVLEPEPADLASRMRFLMHVVGHSHLQMSDYGLEELIEAGLVETDELAEHAEALAEVLPAEHQLTLWLALARREEPGGSAAAWDRALDAASTSEQSGRVALAMQEAGRLDVPDTDGPLLAYDFTRAELEGHAIANGGRYPLPLVLRDGARLGEVDGVRTLRLDGGEGYADTYLHQGVKDAWTVSVWVRGDAGPSDEAPRSVVGLFPFAINWDHRSDGARGAVETYADEEWRHASFGELEGERWYHLVGWFEDDELRAYRDGERITTYADIDGEEVPRRRTMILGRHTRHQTLQGDIAGLHVYDRALSEQEIRALHADPPAGLADRVGSED